MVMLLAIPLNQVERTIRKKQEKNVRGPWLPRSRSVWFTGFHFQTEARGKYEAEAFVQAKKRDLTGNWHMKNDEIQGHNCLKSERLPEE